MRDGALGKMEMSLRLDLFNLIIEKKMDENVQKPDGSEPSSTV